MIKKILKSFTVLISIFLMLVFGFKILGTSYCYIKMPSSKEDANKVISFCGRSDLLFDVFFSKGRAKIYDSYLDNFQNSASASDIIAYYTKNEPLKHLDRIEILINIMVNDRWQKKSEFYFLLGEDFFETNLPLDFRKKVFNELYKKYYIIVKNDNRINKQKRDFLISDMDELNKKLNEK